MDSVKKYADDLSRFLTCILRTSRMKNPVYQFTISRTQQENIDTLYTALCSRPNNNLCEEIHTLLYSLVGVTLDDVDKNQWVNPLTCWLALLSLRTNGRFRESKDYIPILAH